MGNKTNRPVDEEDAPPKKKQRFTLNDDVLQVVRAQLEVGTAMALCCAAPLTVASATGFGTVLVHNDRVYIYTVSNISFHIENVCVTESRLPFEGSALRGLLWASFLRKL